MIGSGRRWCTNIPPAAFLPILFDPNANRHTKTALKRRRRRCKRRPAQVAPCFAEVFRLYEQGKVKPAAATAFPLARAGEALAALRERGIAGRAVSHLRDD